jgi:hypothetical protein
MPRSIQVCCFLFVIFFFANMIYNVLNKIIICATFSLVTEGSGIAKDITAQLAK